MPKQGFKNQWIAISREGVFADSVGKQRDLNDKFLNDVIANFSPDNAPAVIGHPEKHPENKTDEIELPDTAPAYGWVSALRLNEGVLEAQFTDTNDDFEEMVEKGLFRKRSASFYMNPPSLRHVGFLGAKPPAIKGLREIQFSDGDSVTVEISFSEEKQKMKDEEVNQVAESLWEKIKGKFKPEAAATKEPETPTTQFSEEDKKTLIAEVVKQANEAATANFAEQLKTRDDQIKALTESVNANSESGKRAEIVSFVEKISSSSKHYLKRAGIVEFMETLAKDDAADTEKAICFSEGDGDDKVEHKFSRLEWAKELFSNLPATIQFGEKFGNIVATDEVEESTMKRPAKVKSMKAKMGVPAEGGAK